MAKLFVKLEGIEIDKAHETIMAGRYKPGTLVAIRPCGEKYKNKTYLGMYLCSAPTGVIGEQRGDKIILKMSDYVNPAIYLPELDEIVWGYESWWGEIKSEEDLKQITDEDIQNIWYVRALKQIEKFENPE